MSARNPYAAMFRMQRNAIESTRAAAESGLRVGRTTTEALVDSMDAGRSVQKSGVELSRRAAHAYLDAVAETSDGRGVEDARAMVDDQFEAFDAFHDEAWTAFERSLEEFEQSTDELTDAQAEMLADAFDAMLDAQADVEAAADEAVEVEVDEA